MYRPVLTALHRRARSRCRYSRRRRPRASRSGPPAGSGATRCRRATRSRASSFAGTTGYAAGDFGTMLATDDGGATWTGLSSGTFANLDEVQAIDGDSLFAGGGCVGAALRRRRQDVQARRVHAGRVALPPAARRGLVRRPSRSATSCSPTAPCCAPTTTATALRARRSPSRARARPAAASSRPTSASSTPNTGFAATTDGKVYRTADGANSWTSVGDTQRVIRKLLFADAKHGYAVGDGSLFLDDRRRRRHVDAARARRCPRRSACTSISCATADLCVMTTGGNQIVRTADGGATGDARRARRRTRSTPRLRVARRASSALGRSGVTAISDDGGATFAPVGGRLSGRYFAMVAGPAPASPSPPATTARSPRPSTAAGPGRAATSRRPRTSATSRSRPAPTASRSTAPAACSAPATAARPGARSTSARRRPRPRCSRLEDDGAASPARAACAARPTPARRSTPCAVRSTSRRSRGSTAPGGAIIACGFGDIWRSLDGGRTWKAVHKPGTLDQAAQRQEGQPALRRQGRLRHGEHRLGARRGPPLPHRQRRQEVGAAQRRRYVERLRHGVQLGQEGVPGDPALRRRLRAGYLLRTERRRRRRGRRSSWSRPVIGDRGIAAGPGADYLLGGDSSLLPRSPAGLPASPRAPDHDQAARLQEGAEGHDHRDRARSARPRAATG